jgi:hypothetical protein
MSFDIEFKLDNEKDEINLNKLSYNSVKMIEQLFIIKKNKILKERNDLDILDKLKKQKELKLAELVKQSELRQDKEVKENMLSILRLMYCCPCMACDIVSFSVWACIGFAGYIGTIITHQ